MILDLHVQYTIHNILDTVWIHVRYSTYNTEWIHYMRHIWYILWYITRYKCEVYCFHNSTPSNTFLPPRSNNSDYKCGPFIILLHLYCPHICRTSILGFSSNNFEFKKLLLIASTLVLTHTFAFAGLLYFQCNL